MGQICTTVGGLQISQVHYLALKLANIAQVLGRKGQELTETELGIELIDFFKAWHGFFGHLKSNTNFQSSVKRYLSAKNV